MSIGRSRALTLAEVLVAGALFLGLTAAMAYVLRSNYEFERRTEARLELNQQSLVALSKMRRELSESNLPTVRADATTNSVVFPSPRDLNGALASTSGDLAWSKLICYRLDTVKSILYRQQHLETLSTQAIDPLALTPPRDAAYFLVDPTIASMPLARGVAEFEVVRDKRIESSVKLRLNMTRKVGQREYGVEVSTSVSPRN